jgi:hypothetical protein
MRQHIERIAAGEFKRNGHAVAQIVFTSRRHRRVHGKHQRFETRVPGAGDDPVRQFPVGPHVKLKPQIAAGLGGDALQFGHRTQRQCKRHAMHFCRARQRDFTLVPCKTGGAGRRHDHRHLLFFAEQGDVLIAHRHITQHARIQFDAFQYRAIVTHRDFVVVAAIHEFKQAFRQAAHCRFAQIGGVVETQRVVSHGRGCDSIF